jgi:hypothetical protein
MIEMLVTMSLILILVSMTWQVLLPSAHLWSVNQAQAALEDTGLVLQARLTGELQRSSQASVRSVPAGGPGLQALSFSSWGQEDVEDVAESYDFSSGQVEWWRYVVYYVPAGSQTVYRKTWPVGPVDSRGNWPPQTPPMGTASGALDYTFPTGQPRPLRPPDLIALCTTLNGTEREVARAVTRLELVELPPEKACCAPIFTGTNVDLRIDLRAPAPTAQHAVTTQRAQQIQMRL